MYLSYLFGQFHWAILMAGIAGAVYLLARDRAAFALLAFLYLGWLFYALEYNIQDVHYYFIPTYLILAVFATVGLGALWQEAEATTTRFSAKIRTAVLTSLSLLVLAVPLWGLGETYRSVDRSGDYEGRQIIEVVDRNTEPGATIIQLRSPLYYAALVEDRRKDLKLLSYFEAQNNEEPRTKEEKDARINAAARDGSLYALYPDKYLQRSRWLEEAGYRLVSIEGDMLYKVVPAEA
jgi:hypothetical protein